MQEQNPALVAAGVNVAGDEPEKRHGGVTERFFTVTYIHPSSVRLASLIATTKQQQTPNPKSGSQTFNALDTSSSGVAQHQDFLL